MEAQRELVVRFAVREDLPSERSLEYRDLIIRALKEYGCSHDATQDDHEMIDRIMNDYQTGVVAEAVKLRRTVRRCINDVMQGDSGEVPFSAEPYESLDVVLSEFIDSCPN